MAKTIAQMRAQALDQTARASTRFKEVCLRQDLIAKVQQLREEKTDLLANIGRPSRDVEDGSSGPPARSADPRRSRVKEIDDELVPLYDAMRDETGVLTLESEPAGDWRRWADAHPAREGSMIDAESGYGYCNITALLDRIGDFAVAWNNDPMSQDEWAFIATSMGPGDLKECCELVVQMQEGVGALAPKLPSSSSTTTTGSPG